MKVPARVRKLESWKTCIQSVLGTVMVALATRDNLFKTLFMDGGWVEALKIQSLLYVNGYAVF